MTRQAYSTQQVSECFLPPMTNILESVVQPRLCCAGSVGSAQFMVPWLVSPVKLPRCPSNDAVLAKGSANVPTPAAPPSPWADACGWMASIEVVAAVGWSPCKVLAPGNSETTSFAGEDGLLTGLEGRV